MLKKNFYFFYFGHVFLLFSERFLFKKNVGKVHSGKLWKMCRIELQALAGI